MPGAELLGAGHNSSEGMTVARRAGTPYASVHSPLLEEHHMTIRVTGCAASIVISIVLKIVLNLVLRACRAG